MIKKILDIVDNIRAKKISKILDNLDNSVIRVEKMKKSELFIDLLNEQFYNAKKYFEEKEIKPDKLVLEVDKSLIKKLNFNAYKKTGNYYALIGNYKVVLTNKNVTINPDKYLEPIIIEDTKAEENEQEDKK